MNDSHMCACPAAAAIDEGDYSRAWELAAVNRLDLNVLVDYRWPSFLGHAAQFVAQVSAQQLRVQSMSGALCWSYKRIC